MRWVVHFLSTGIHGVAGRDIFRERVNRYKRVLVVSIVTRGNDSRKANGAILNNSKELAKESWLQFGGNEVRKKVVQNEGLNCKR
jgi:hypothetical protein